MVESKEKPVESVMKDFTKKINDNADKVKGWGKAFKLAFTDISVVYWIKVSMDGTVEKVEKGSESALKTKEAVATINTSVDTLAGLLDGSIAPMTAMISRQIMIEGSQAALGKLAPAFG